MLKTRDNITLLTHMIISWYIMWVTCDNMLKTRRPWPVACSASHDLMTCSCNIKAADFTAASRQFLLTCRDKHEGLFVLKKSVFVFFFPGWGRGLNRVNVFIIDDFCENTSSEAVFFRAKLSWYENNASVVQNNVLTWSWIFQVRLINEKQTGF